MTNLLSETGVGVSLGDRLQSAPVPPTLTGTVGAQTASLPPELHVLAHRALSNEFASQRRDDLGAASAAGLLAAARKASKLASDSPTATARLAVTMLICDEPAEDVVHVATRAGELATGSSLDMPAAVIAAQILIRLNEHEQARHILASFRQHLVPRMLLAELSSQAGDVEEAMAILKTFGTTDSHAFMGYLLLLKGRPQPALHELRLARAGSLSDSPSVLANMALALRMLGSTSKACRLATEAALLSPFDPNLRAAKADILVHSRRAAEAAADLRRWRASPHAQTTKMIVLAEANALAASSQSAKALQRLREGASEPLVGTAVDRAEIAGHAATLSFQMGKMTRPELVKVLRIQNDRASRDSIPLACMLADALFRLSAHTEISNLYQHLSLRHRSVDLLPLQFRVRAAAGDPEGQLAAAREWVEAWPLDPAPAASIVGLLTDLDRYEEAANDGIRYLKIMGRNEALCNNTAYALTMSGRASQARKLLRQIADVEPDPYLIATRALVELALGDVAAGIAGYDAATKMVRVKYGEGEDADALCAMLGVQLRLVIRHLDLDVHGKVLIPAPLIDDQWRDRPDVEAMRRRARRLHIPWV
jgi:tetratricopeptide (TPR) repeat protein